MNIEPILDSFNKEKQKENKEMLIILIFSLILLVISIPFFQQILKEEEQQIQGSHSVLSSFCEFYQALSKSDKDSLQTPLNKQDNFCANVIKFDPLMSGFIGGYPKTSLSFKGSLKLSFIMFNLILIMTFILSFLDKDNNKNILLRSLPKETDLWHYDWIYNLKKSKKLNSIEDFNQWMTLPERYTENQLTLMKLVFKQETLNQKFKNILTAYTKQ